MPNESELASVYETIPQFPHCDSRVLHAPSNCVYCDQHPQWQALRVLWGINFSGESDPEKLPCPSERDRPAFVIHQWPGNQATEHPVRTTPRNIYEMINEDDPV